MTSRRHGEALFRFAKSDVALGTRRVLDEHVEQAILYQIGGAATLQLVRAARCCNLVQSSLLFI